MKDRMAGLKTVAGRYGQREQGLSENRASVRKLGGENMEPVRTSEPEASSNENASQGSIVAMRGASRLWPVLLLSIPWGFGGGLQAFLR